MKRINQGKRVKKIQEEMFMAENVAFFQNQKWSSHFKKQLNQFNKKLDRFSKRLDRFGYCFY